MNKASGTHPSSLTPHPSERGFALAATLWILTAITLSASFFALWAQNAMEATHQTREDVQGEIDMSSTCSVILYLLATQYKTLAGLTIPGDEPTEQEKATVNAFENSVLPVGGEISLDDQPYKGLGKACFSIQDERGLLGLKNVHPPQLEKLLGLLGVPAEHRGPLMDKLRDYTDKDDLHRLNGAEAEDYERLGLALPPNRELLTSWEARNVMGWNAYPSLWKDNRFPRLATVATGGMPNLNTAPREILKTIAGIDHDMAVRLISARKETPFSSIREASQSMGKVLAPDSMGVAFFPSAYLRVTLWHTSGRGMRECHVRLTPQADKKAPWLIDYELSVPMTQEQPHEDLPSIPIPAFTAPISPDSG